MKVQKYTSSLSISLSIVISSVVVACPPVMITNISLMQNGPIKPWFPIENIQMHNQMNDKQEAQGPYRSPE